VSELNDAEQQIELLQEISSELVVLSETLAGMLERQERLFSVLNSALEVSPMSKEEPMRDLQVALEEGLGRSISTSISKTLSEELGRIITDAWRSGLRSEAFRRSLALAIRKELAAIQQGR